MALGMNVIVTFLLNIALTYVTHGIAGNIAWRRTPLCHHKPDLVNRSSEVTDHDLLIFVDRDGRSVVPLTLGEAFIQIWRFIQFLILLSRHQTYVLRFLQIHHYNDIKSLQLISWSFAIFGHVAWRTICGLFETSMQVTTTVPVLSINLTIGYALIDIEHWRPSLCLIWIGESFNTIQTSFEKIQTLFIEIAFVITWKECFQNKHLIWYVVAVPNFRY